MKRIFCIAILFISFLNLTAYSQANNDVTQNIVSKLKALSGDRIIEKAYLHFDKPYYATGDTMYFKAYVTLGERHDLSKASGIMYVDLIDPQNTVIRSIKLQLVNGTGWGDFALSDSLQKGYYRVRAYTRYMQNAPEYFFDRSIPIGSVNMSASNVDTRQTAKADIQFFPEGGDLVAGVISKVAFKAIGTNGMGVGVSGVITDNTNREVGKFNSTHLGMGSFFIEPEDGKNYKAKVTFADGSQNTVNLPAIDSKGIFLVVTDTLDKLSIEVHCNKGYLQDNMNHDLNLLMYTGGFVSSVTFKLDSRVSGLDVPKSKFPSGIVRIALFSQSGEPLSERLVFVKNTDLLNLSLNSDKTVYKKRERVHIGLNAKTGKGDASEGSFSVAVIDESKVPVNESDETTILTSLLLTNELKGYVEQPGYYFSANPAAKADLDVLLLTQGYRRFSWRELISDRNVPFAYQPEKDLVISGSLKATTGTPVMNKDILLREMASNNLATQKTDNQGKFMFIIPVFMDGTLFTLQATGSSKDKNSTLITLDKESSEPAVAEKNIPESHRDANQQMQAYLDAKQSPNGDLVQSGGSSTRAGNTHADQTLQGSDISGASSLTSGLNGKLNGVDFVQGLPHLKGVTDPMLIVINGKIRGSYIELDNIAPNNIDNIQVLKGNNANAYGTWGNAGVLVINTKQGVSTSAVPAQNTQYTYQATKGAPLKNTKVTGASTVNYRSSNLGGPGHADQVILAKDIENASSMVTALNGRLRGVDFVNGVPVLRGQTQVSSGGQGAVPMLLVVDGVMGSSTGIDNINPHSVEAVEVLKNANAAIYGEAGGGGVIVITTKQGSQVEQNFTSSLGNLKFAPKGFYKAKEFYVPKYDVSGTAGKPDMRTTILWKPEVVTDKTGAASVEYYNADGTGYYRVVVEGIDNAGNIGRQVYRYKVQ